MYNSNSASIILNRDSYWIKKMLGLGWETDNLKFAVIFFKYVIPFTPKLSFLFPLFPIFSFHNISVCFYSSSAVAFFVGYLWPTQVMRNNSRAYTPWRFLGLRSNPFFVIASLILSYHGLQSSVIASPSHVLPPSCGLDLRKFSWT